MSKNNHQDDFAEAHKKLSVAIDRDIIRRKGALILSTHSFRSGNQFLNSQKIIATLIGAGFGANEAVKSLKDMSEKMKLDKELIVDLSYKLDGEFKDAKEDKTPYYRKNFSSSKRRKKW